MCELGDEKGESASDGRGREDIMKEDQKSKLERLELEREDEECVSGYVELFGSTFIVGLETSYFTPQIENGWLKANLSV